MSTVRNASALCLATVAFASVLAGIGSHALAVDSETSTQAAADSLDRPEASLIKAETRRILADPRYTPRKSLAQWLMEKLGNWEWPLGDEGWALAPVAFWGIVVVCVATLLAILAHLVWTIAVYFLSGRSPAGLGRRRPADAGLIPRDASFEELVALRDRLAGEGRFREAIGVMLLVLVRWLDRQGLVEFHHSKTNGEYVGEFPRQHAGREAFAGFVNLCDGAVYSASPCSRQDYRRLEAAIAQVRSHVDQDA